jgi:hypothetical protein
MLQCIFMPSAFAASTQQSVALPPQQLLRAGVSVVHLVVTYSSDSGGGPGTAHPTATPKATVVTTATPTPTPSFQCTGLGVIVASWKPASSTDANNLILTDGNLVQNDAAKCVTPQSQLPATPKFTLSSITVFFSSAFNNKQVILSTTSTPLSVRCQDKTTCSNSFAIFAMHSDGMNPFLTTTTSDATATTGIELTKGTSSSSPTGLSPSTKQDANYLTAVRGNLVPSLNKNPLTGEAGTGEAGMPLVDATGNLVTLQLTNVSTIIHAAVINDFVTTQQPEWSAHQLPDTNTVKTNWDTGMTDFYKGKASYAEANTAFNTAVRANPQFQGAQQLANDTQGVPSPPQNIPFPLLGSFLASWLRFILVGVGVLVLLIVLLVIFPLVRRRIRVQREFEKEFREAQRAADEMAAKERMQQEPLRSQTPRPQPLIGGHSQPSPLLQTQLPQEQLNIRFNDKANITPPPVQQQVTKLPCPVCGTSVVSTARWCPNCGTSLTLADSGLRMVVQPSQSPKPAPVVEKKSAPSLPVEKKPISLPSLQAPTPSVLEQKVEKKVVVPTSSAEPQQSLINAQEKSKPKNNVRAENRAGKQLGNYRLMRLIGYGAFADVYLGEHIYLETQAAIKVLRKRLGAEDVGRFLNEAKTVARFDHPHIVRILEFGEDSNEFGVEQNAAGVDGRIPFLVMEYAPGGTLRNRHPKGSILPLSIITPYINQVADALQYAHDKKLIHRDVKPENILIANNNRLLLSDFGVVAIAHTDGSMTTQDMIGTVPYMSPEQFQGRPRPSSDQYALAIVVYEWLCEHTPYQGAPIEVAMQHMTAALPSLRSSAPSISPVVEAVISKALAKDPLQRFESVQAFARALAQAR